MNDFGLWCMVAGLLTGAAFFFGLWAALIVAAIQGKRWAEREYTFWERVARKEEPDPRKVAWTETHFFKESNTVQIPKAGEDASGAIPGAVSEGCKAPPSPAPFSRNGRSKK